MSAYAGNAAGRRLRAFLGVAHKRLWLADIRAALRAPLWIAAATLLSLGLLHHRVHPVPTRFTVGASALALLLAAVLAATRRPSMARSAALADKRLGGKSLLTTAWQCLALAEAERPAAARIVISQAERFAARNLSRLAETGFPGRGADLLAPLVFAGLGFVVLLLPGAARPPAQDGIPAFAVEEISTAAAASREDAVAAISDALRKDRLARSTLSGQIGDPSGQGEPSAADPVGSEPAAAGAVDRPLRNPVAAGAGGGDRAGRGRDAGGESNPAVELAAAFAGREDVAIGGTGQAAAVAAGSGGAFAGGGDGRASPPPVARAASPPNAADIRALTPAQAAYAAQYMNQAGRGDEQRIQ